MTLKEKFIEAFKSGKRFDIENAEQVAEEFAIGFMKWFYENAYLIEWLSNDNKREQLLKAYKKTL